MVRILTSIFLMFTGWGSALAQEAESQALTPEEVARAYMAAYSDLDLDTMASFMSEDIIFIDNTNPDPSLGPDGISETGPGEIRHALKDFMEE